MKKSTIQLTFALTLGFFALTLVAHQTNRHIITHQEAIVKNLLAPPVNDDCSSATLLAINSTTCTPGTVAPIAGTTIDANNSVLRPNASCQFPGGVSPAQAIDVWYSFVAQAGQAYTVTVSGAANLDAVVSLYADCATNANLAGACADNTSSGGTETLNITAPGVIGSGATTTYLIRVYDWSVSLPLGGNFTIGVSGATLVASESHTAIACNGGSSTVTISATGGTAPYTGTGTFMQSAGTTNYTVTDATGCMNSIAVTVTQPAPVFVAPITGSNQVNVNSTTQLADATPGGVWDSSNDNIATVGVSGLVTGVAVGMATISYTVTDGGGCTNSAALTMTVNPALPVKLVDFVATVTPDYTVSLKWTAATEVNFAYYGVEHSADGRQFDQVGQVEAKGTAALTTIYAYVHRTPPSGLNYYRLRLVNRDGTFEYSPIRSVQLDQRNNFKIVPTPTRGPLTLWSEHLDQYPAGLKYRLTDGNGKLVLTNSITQERTDLNMSSYATGIYYLTVFSDREQLKQFKVIVSRD